MYTTVHTTNQVNCIVYFLILSTCATDLLQLSVSNHAVLDLNSNYTCSFHDLIFTETPLI